MSMNLEFEPEFETRRERDLRKKLNTQGNLYQTYRIAMEADLARSEKTVREQQIEIDRLKRALAEAVSR